MTMEQIISQVRNACRLVQNLSRITLSQEELSNTFAQLSEILPPLNEVVGSVTGVRDEDRSRLTLALISSESRAIAFFEANAALFPA